MIGALFILLSMERKNAVIEIKKYPRTQHIEGSRLQAGDHDLSQFPFLGIKGINLVIEEKVDGANAGISFDETGALRLQSRGHFLVGGPREKHWALFKKWAAVHEDELFDMLGSRYVMYGEWLFAKHTVFYDFLPHYFLEFDVYDRENDCFLSTQERRNILNSTIIKSVLVIKDGKIDDLEELKELVRPSYFKTGSWRRNLEMQAKFANVDIKQALNQTDDVDDMEGLYIKVEADGVVKERLKWVRHSFVSKLVDSDSHWSERPIIQNMLAPGIDIFKR